MAIAGVKDALGFIRAWLSDPLHVGAVTPSGMALANAITAEITPASAPVIELGAGTGVFARALINRGVPEEQIALVEYRLDFGRLLRLRFPRAQVLNMDAALLGNVTIFNGTLAGAVVSGLPLLSIAPEQVAPILAAAFSHLRPGGVFYQFTYGMRCPVAREVLEALGLAAERIGNAIVNVPPAAVYRIRRCSEG